MIRRPLAVDEFVEERWVDMPVETVLGDGTPAMIWPLLPTDGQSLRQAFAEMSPRSRRLRFLSPLDDLDSAMLRRLVDDVDQDHHVAFVMVVFPADGRPEHPVGIARLVAYDDDPTVAELAVTVVDEWQGVGAGTLLADVLMQHRPARVRRLLTEVATDNPASIAMLRRLGALRLRLAYPGVYEATVVLPLRRHGEVGGVDEPRSDVGHREADGPAAVLDQLGRELEDARHSSLL
jgi:RimJ/RimL family protein N-acetyltransferase